ncbi:alpha-2-HS-glycoprotein [Hemicordylus capensis]|uniref:alpha-2-HS-glycoprotein n=1 Tax=Hemicordylus capensis TaxID=884348 RepID=UPI0023031C3B|nr:alpha-2-HS-glycoprotein [Hemicordylus capensis]
MRSLVALVLLAQLFSCKATSPPFFPPLVHRIVGCDDPETEEAAAVAVDYINSHSLHGYKYALNVIENVKVLPRRPFGELWHLELDLLETDCHVSNPMPVANCTVRKRTQHAVEGDCDVRMLKANGRFSVTSTKCHSSPDSAEDVVKFCPDCPLLALLNDPAVVSAADAALLVYNSLETTLEHYMITEIARAQHTHMPPAVHVEFAIGSTNCTHHANEHVDDNCHLETGNHSHAGFCKATVFKTLNESGEVECEIYKEAGHSRSHKHLAGHHIGGNLPSPGHGHTVLNLIHSHNNTLASHESHESAERVVPAVLPAVVKRAAVEVASPKGTASPAVPLGPLKLCPGRTRHFTL